MLRDWESREVESLFTFYNNDRPRAISKRNLARKTHRKKLPETVLLLSIWLPTNYNNKKQKQAKQCVNNNFQDHNGRKVVASFDGGYLSSDGAGTLLFRELELKTATIRGLAGCFRDQRNPDLIEHSVKELLRQRIGALAMGYEDLKDHDSLRHDRAHGLMAGKAYPRP